MGLRVNVPPMPETYWYAYDKTGQPTEPFYETREEAREACGEDELVRPVTAEFVDTDTEDDGGVEPYAELGHDELKQEAEERGIADDIDLRSKDAVIEALREYDENE
jgi:hypothetical protein